MEQSVRAITREFASTSNPAMVAANVLESYRRLVVSLASVEQIQPPADLATSIRVDAAKSALPWESCSPDMGARRDGI